MGNSHTSQTGAIPETKQTSATAAVNKLSPQSTEELFRSHHHERRAKDFQTFVLKTCIYYTETSKVFPEEQKCVENIKSHYRHTLGMVEQQAAKWE